MSVFAGYRFGRRWQEQEDQTDSPKVRRYLPQAPRQGPPLESKCLWVFVTDCVRVLNCFFVGIYVIGSVFSAVSVSCEEDQQQVQCRDSEEVVHEQGEQGPAVPFPID